MKKCIPVVVTVMLLCLWHTQAAAVPAFGIAQNPAVGSQVDMRSPQTITFTITNSNTAGSTDRIYQMRFRMPNGSSTIFTNATAPPNWTRTNFGSRSVTFRANCWAYAIAPGGTLNFPIVFTMGNKTVDTTETLRDVRASFTLTNNFVYYNACGANVNATTSGTVTLPNNNGGSCAVMTSAGTPAINTCVSWKLMSLAITYLQTTDCAGNAIATINAGSNFCLVMKVKNNSSTTQGTAPPVANGIVSNPTLYPVVAGNLNIVGTVALPGNSAPTTYNPANFNLASQATGTITFQFTTASTDNGTIQFINLIAQRGATVTSRMQNSNVLQITNVNVSIVITGPLAAAPDCIFANDTATFTMTVKNNRSVAITYVTPSALACPNCAPNVNIGAYAGPLPGNCIANIAGNGGTGTFTWTAPVTGTIMNPNVSFYVTGNVNFNKAGSCGAGGGINSVLATSNTENLYGYVVNVNPATTNAASRNEELTWTVENDGCAAVQSVTISKANPDDWIWTGVDYYSLVGNANNELWTDGGAASLPVTFSAAGGQLPLTEDGSFSLVFPTTPTPAVTPTVYNFNVTITDANATPIVKTLPTSLTVNAFDSTPAGPNSATTGVWKEIIQ